MALGEQTMADKNVLDSAMSPSNEIGRIAFRSKIEAIRTAIKSSPQLSNQDLSKLMRNFDGILNRLKRTSPEAHSQILSDVFNGSRSQLSKFTNPSSKERRTKLTSYLKKADAISRCIIGLVQSDHTDASFLEYQAEKVLVDLISGTRLDEDPSERLQNSNAVSALDDLWMYLNEIPEYIDRETRLSQEYSNFWDFDFTAEETTPYHFLTSESRHKYLFDHIEWFGESTENIELWNLFIRHPICPIAEHTIRGRLYFSDIDTVVNSIPDKGMRGMVELYPDRLIDDELYVPKDKLRDVCDSVSINFQLQEYFNLVLKPRGKNQNLCFKFMLAHDTLMQGHLFNERKVPANRWNGPPSKSPKDNSFYQNYVTLSEDGKTVLWPVFEHLPDFTEMRDSFYANPDFSRTRNYGGDEGSLETMRDYDITRFDLDRWNGKDLFDINIDYTGNWDSRIPSDLKQASLAHFLEFILIDTAATSGDFDEDYFVIPTLLEKAKRRASDLMTLHDKLNAVKRNSRSRLNKVLEGEIPLA
jgi:hypothetical protein